MLVYQNNFIGILKIMIKNVDILATSLSVLHKYFDKFNKSLIKLFFLSVFS